MSSFGDASVPAKDCLEVFVQSADGTKLDETKEVPAAVAIENGGAVASSNLANQITAEELMQNPQVLATLQNRLKGIFGQSSGYIGSLPNAVKRRVNALKNLQVISLSIESKFYEEIHRLEAKYMALYAPLFEKRRDIVNGVAEPTDSECEWESDEDSEDNDENNELPKNKDNINSEKTEDTKGIPEFWLTIFKTTDTLQDMVQDHDEPILRSLKDIRVIFSRPDEQMSFTLEFIFEPNDYFTNPILKKTYEMRAKPDENDPLSFDGPEIICCTGCDIDWKKGKNVTVKTIKKKQKHKGHGTVRTINKQVTNDSFFNFFSPPEVPKDDDAELDSDTENLLSSDFDIGHLIRERIVPRAVLYFTGEAEMDCDYDEEEEGDTQSVDGSGDSEGELDYDSAKDPKGKEDQPTECKQQ